jgi:cell division inhibitor SepF
MDELALQDKPGIISRFVNIFVKSEDDEEFDGQEPSAARDLQVRSAYRYTVTIRRQITSFEDALAAANGLKRGEQQILNLSSCDTTLRQKIVDFMCGVNFAQEGTWEEVGDDVYLIVPANAYVEVAPASPRTSALKN